MEVCGNGYSQNIVTTSLFMTLVKQYMLKIFHVCLLISKYCIHFLLELCSNFSSSGRFNSSLFQGNGGDGIAMAASD